jgi:hypothetical protein
MLDEQDIKRLTEVLATKQDVQEIQVRLERLVETVAGLVTVVAGLVRRVEMPNEEYLVIKERDSRHERWIKEIAEKVGVTLTV